MKNKKNLSICVQIFCTAFFFSIVSTTDGQNVAPQENIFAERPLVHILGPSPAITPSSDESAVDSRILESCDVLKDNDGKYYWYYHAQSKDKERWPGGYRICVAIADNPLGPWIKYENNPVLDHGQEGQWDSRSVDCVVILKSGAYDISNEDQKYYMFFDGAGPNGRNIGFATADNPLGPWKKYENNPIVKDFGYLSTVNRIDGKFYMHAQHPVSVADQGPFKIATADNIAGPWTKYEGNPVMTPGDWGAWDDGGYSEARVRYHEGIYHCVYGGTKTPKIEALGYAYSFDGIHWNKYTANPVVPLARIPDGSGFAETHCFVEGSNIYVFHTLRYFTGEGTARGLGSVPRWETEDLAVQVLTIDPQYKFSFPVLFNISLDAGQSSRLAECLPIGLEAVTGLAISAECTYEGAAKAGLRLHVRASEDGVHCDTDDLYTFDLPFRAGQNVKKTFEMSPKVKFAKVIVENLDGSNKASDVSVTVTVGN
ncbi:hypothetical protein ACFLSP_03705 [Bacteroidota bacterium]